MTFFFQILSSLLMFAVSVLLCSRYSERGGEGEAVDKGRCQKGSEGRVRDLGKGTDPLSEGREQTLRIQSSHELRSHGDEEPAW